MLSEWQVKDTVDVKYDHCMKPSTFIALNIGQRSSAKQSGNLKETAKVIIGSFLQYK